MAKKKQEQRQFLLCYKQKGGDLAKRLPTMGRMELWKKLLFKNMSEMFRINLASIICFIPVIYILMRLITDTSAIAGNLPFSSFIGAGYPAIVDSQEILFVETQKLFSSLALLWLPLGMFVSVFLSVSTQFAIRNLVWTEGFFKIKTLFRSFKFNWLNGLLNGFLAGLLTMGGAYILILLRKTLFYSGWSFINVVYVVLFAVLAIILATIIMYASSIIVTYKGSYFKVLADAIKLTFTFPIPNLLVTIATLAPLVLVVLLSGFFRTLIVVAFAFVGFSFMMLTFTVYSQFIFDRVTGRG